MVWYRWAAWVLPLLLWSGASFPDVDAAVPPTDERISFDVALPGLNDRVVLRPHDIRAPGIRDDGPTPPGHLRGTLTTSGATVHLILRDEASLGLLAGPDGTTWVHVVEDRLVPYPVETFGPLDPTPYEDDAMFAPEEEGTVAPAANPRFDGRLQIDIERDGPLVDRMGVEDSYVYSLDVMFLTEAIFYAQFRIEFEVTTVWHWPDGDPYGSRTGSSLLRGIRDQWESSAWPTQGHDREVMQTFSGRDSPGINGIAYVRQLETAWAYGLHELRDDYHSFWQRGVPHPLEVITNAHEIGHNFDGRHALAFPQPAGTADPLSQGHCVTTKYGTILFPCGAPGRVPSFSDAPTGSALLETLDLLRDGGNVPRMRDYSDNRI